MKKHRPRRNHAEAEKLAWQVYHLHRLNVSRKYIAEFLGISQDMAGHYLRHDCKAGLRAGTIK
jgi:predicted transcriptional regulator